MRSQNPFLAATLRKEEKQKQKKQIEIYKTINSIPLQGTSNQIVEYFNFRLQARVSQTDQTVAWEYNIPILNPNQKTLFLVTETFSTILQDFIGDDFPQSISIGIRNFAGFIGANGVASNKAIVMNLAQINSNVQNGYVKRDLIYKNESPASWPLGSLRNLKFELYVDQSSSPVSFPIQNPVAIMFKVLHLSM